MPDAEVRQVTGRAVVAARRGDVIKAAGDARETLRALPGFGRGTALASALLTAAAPARLAVFDKRARSGLGKVGLELTDDAPFFYARYMMLIELGDKAPFLAVSDAAGNAVERTIMPALAEFRIFLQ